jgi:hypothetical protein
MSYIYIFQKSCHLGTKHDKLAESDMAVIKSLHYLVFNNYEVKWREVQLEKGGGTILHGKGL